MKVKHPRDARYGSVSAFYTFIMEEIMERLENSKNPKTIDEILSKL